MWNKPTLTPLTTKQAQRIDNAIKQRKVTGWTMAGGCYPQKMQGRRMPGHVHLTLEGGGFIYYAENTPLDTAFDDADDRGFDTTQVRIDLAHWVATGEGVKFDLKG